MKQKNSIDKITYNGSDLILAPIAGYSDSGMRTLCFSYGAGLCFTEMVSAKGLHYKNENTEELLHIGKEEINTGVQIFGSDADIIAEVIRSDALKRFNIIDINMGCPVPKVVKNGDGSALLNNPDLVFDIVKKAKEAAGSRDITVKIRKGIGGKICAKEIALAAQEGGASMVTVHGRTREQMYSGTTDYDIIAEVKSALNIPVCGNGDVVDIESYKKMKDAGADYVMVARGAIGRPYLFSELNGTEPEYSVKKLIRKHIECLSFLPDKTVCGMMKKQIAAYVKGIPGQKRIKEEIFACVNLPDMLAVVENLP